MGKQRRQSNRGKANRGGGSGGRGAALRGSQSNRGGERVPRAGRGSDALTVKDVLAMGDDERFALSESELPDAPKGYVYAEDRTLVPKSFYG